MTKSPTKMAVHIASPPDREKLVAMISHGSEQWAELNQETNNLILELYPRPDGKPWAFSFDEAMTALHHAKRRLIGDNDIQK
ncbi:MAG TPA: hypothetical protein VK815_04995 [Candidatus Acidoferrales bacterium]|jgi:hypothetical protein|nr:hypothetical protein [Candidatus Acidoferrales bacterium]